MRRFTLITTENTEALEDYGFFGPDSPTWKVWSHPTSIALAFIRATTIEHLDPNLTAAVVQSGGVVSRPASRYDRTLHYFALVKFGDSVAATKAANVLVKVHAKAVGDDPVTGGRYDANDPDSQLWIHVTAWHSILYCYEKFGPGKLSPAEEDRYWQEMAIAAELQTINLEDVPRNREEVRAYFDAWRPRVVASEEAQFMYDFILDGVDYVIPKTNLPVLKQLRRLAVKQHRMAVIATYPRYQRRLAGIQQSALTDWLITAVTRPGYRIAGSRPFRRIQPTFLNIISPSTVPVAAPMLLGIAPRNPQTVTPQEARERLGMLSPREEYARFRSLIEQRRAAGASTESELGIGPDLAESRELIGPTA